jgi:hypothetical protein
MGQFDTYDINCKVTVILLMIHILSFYSVTIDHSGMSNGD